MWRSLLESLWRDPEETLTIALQTIIPVVTLSVSIWGAFTFWTTTFGSPALALGVMLALESIALIGFVLHVADLAPRHPFRALRHALPLLPAKRPLTEPLKSLLVVSRSSASPNRLPLPPPRPTPRVQPTNPPAASPSSANLNPPPTPPALLQHPTPPNRQTNPPAGSPSSASLNPLPTPPAPLHHPTPPNRRINPPAGLRCSASPNRPLPQWSPRQRLAQQAQQ